MVIHVHLRRAVRSRTAAARDAEKVSKAAADYTPRSPESNEACKLCVMFRGAPGWSGEHAGACTKVEGVVDACGWCKYFYRRPDGRAWNGKPST